MTGGKFYATEFCRISSTTILQALNSSLIIFLKNIFNCYLLLSKRKIKVEENKQNKARKSNLNRIFCFIAAEPGSPPLLLPLEFSPLTGENTGAHVCLPNVESNAQPLLREALLAVTHGFAPGPADFRPLERFKIAKGREDWQKY